MTISALQIHNHLHNDAYMYKLVKFSNDRYMHCYSRKSDGMAFFILETPNNGALLFTEDTDIPTDSPVEAARYLATMEKPPAAFTRDEPPQIPQVENPMTEGA